VDAVAIPLSWLDSRQEGMPDEAIDLGKVNPRLILGIEQAQLHPAGDLGKEGEIRAGTVIGGAKRVRGGLFTVAELCACPAC